jgi:outer membrane protein OmpA-like peptidoglycan-associated protein
LTFQKPEWYNSFRKLKVSLDNVNKESAMMIHIHRNGFLAGVLALALLVSSLGCATMKEHKVASGAVIGGVVGAAAGAAIDKDRRERGAIIGGVVGAAAGAGIGYLLERQAKRYEQIEDVDVIRVPEEKDSIGDTDIDSQEHLNLQIHSDILFKDKSSTLTAKGSEKIGEIAQVLNDYPKNRVVVVGYASNEGDEAFTMELSKRRADVVRNELIRRGVAGSRIEAVGMGESDAVADNDTAWGRSQNRRVEIKVYPVQ